LFSAEPANRSAANTSLCDETHNNILGTTRQLDGATGYQLSHTHIHVKYAIVAK